MGLRAYGQQVEVRTIDRSEEGSTNNRSEEREMGSRSVGRQIAGQREKSDRQEGLPQDIHEK